MNYYTDNDHQEIANEISSIQDQNGLFLMILSLLSQNYILIIGLVPLT